MKSTDNLTNSFYTDRLNFLTQNIRIYELVMLLDQDLSRGSRSINNPIENH